MGGGSPPLLGFPIWRINNLPRLVSMLIKRKYKIILTIISINFYIFADLTNQFIFAITVISLVSKKT
jgi:hypothetical protein